MEKRIYVKASTIPTPNFHSIKDAGCKEDKEGICPMLSNNIPDEKNGCNTCRKIKATWLIRDKILETVNESDLEKMKFYDLDSKDKVRKIIDDNYERLGYLGSEPLFDFVKQYCSFEADSYAIRIENEGKQIGDGRHRVKIAQNLDLEIPVHWL